MTFARKAAMYATAAVLSFGLVFAVGCGDVYRPIANPITNPGGDPQNREVDAVINSNPSDAPGSATYVDVSGDVNIGNVSGGKGVTRASFDPYNLGLYMPSPGSSNVSYILNTYSSSGITTTTRNITVSANSNPIAVFPGTSSMYTMNAGKNTDCPNSGSVGVIDISSQTLSQNICVGSSPVWAVFASSQNMLFVLDNVDSTVTAIYTPQNAIKAVIPVGTNPVWAGLSLSGNHLFVVNKGTNDVTVIDVNALAVAVLSVPTGGTAPVSGYLDRKQDRLYVVNQGSATLSSFNASDPLTLTALHPPVQVGPAPSRVSATTDGELLYVANTGNNTITKVLANTFTVASSKTITVSSDSTLRVTDIGVSKISDSKTGSKVYVSAVSPDDLSNQTFIINTIDDSVAASLAAPSQNMSTCQTDVKACVPQRQRPMQIVGTN